MGVPYSKTFPSGDSTLRFRYPGGVRVQVPPPTPMKKHPFGGAFSLVWRVDSNRFPWNCPAGSSPAAQGCRYLRAIGFCPPQPNITEARSSPLHFYKKTSCHLIDDGRRFRQLNLPALAGLFSGHPHSWGKRSAVQPQTIDSEVP